MYSKKTSLNENKFASSRCGNLRVSTAAVNELHKRATAAAIRKNIVNCSVKLGILQNQIYSHTIDNGFNF